MVKLLQVVIPHNKGDAVVDVLHVFQRQGLGRDAVWRQNLGQATMISVPVTDAHLWALSKDLSDYGIGRNIGSMYVLPVDSSLPLLKAPPSTASSTRNIRVTNETLYANISGGVGLTFDYIAMLMVASIIAGAGLASNSSVVVVASMLVSPLMGPILGICLGLAMVMQKDWGKYSGYLGPYKRLIWRSILAEIIGLLVCIAMGAVVSLLFLNWGPIFGIGSSENVEMYGRTVPRNLLVGVLIAAPSGAGVALAVSQTSGGINSLVGVAISASLLPPAVNAGMLWVYGLAGPEVHPQEKLDRSQLMVDGVISLCLVLVNIAVIIVVATIFFKIRGAEPHIEALAITQHRVSPDVPVGPIMVHDFHDIEMDTTMDTMMKATAVPLGSDSPRFTGLDEDEDEELVRPSFE